MKLHEEIMDCLKRRSKAEYEYINPHFLLKIEEALCAYYECEDDGVEEWIRDMFSA